MNPCALGWCGALLVVAAMAGCGKKPDANGRACVDREGSAICVVGAGPDPAHGLCVRWASEYGKQAPGVHVGHERAGADTAVGRLQAGKVDFATTGAELEFSAATARTLQHLPLALGAVAVIYHEAGIGAGLRLSPAALARFLAGHGGRWNEPLVADANPDQHLPDRPVVIVPAQAGSVAGESARRYLARAGSGWSAEPTTAAAPRAALGQDFEDGLAVAHRVQTTPWSVALVELGPALVEGVAVAAIQNRAGRYVAPSPGAMAAAVKGVDLPDSLTISLLDAAGPDAYPMTLFTYVLVPQDAPDRARGEAVLRFLWWASHDGQAVVEAAQGAPLPARIVAALEGRLKELKAGGRQVLAGP
jgi:phosphate transport system substrate-binding protein